MMTIFSCIHTLPPVPFMMIAATLASLFQASYCALSKLICRVMDLKMKVCQITVPNK